MTGISRRSKVLIKKAYDALPEGDAFDYTGADFRNWCDEAGFKRYEFIKLAGPTSAAVAYK